ncbi:MAG: UDP-2,3-diacylglucosamine diphosphatase [Planctomycetes bacterium]|nr:UDP-2,3-diacylglucosamine diphosphatase [Planctomycetota bacterium]
MTRVLGTQLFAGDDAPAAVLISDLHVPADGGAVVAHLDAALRAAAAAQAKVFVLGDLFDSYVSARQVRTGVWRDVAARFAAATAAGTEIVLLHGNRDFLLGPEFTAASGVRLVPGGLQVRLAGVPTLLLHGDELCQNDVPYQRAKRWLRHPCTRALARRLPLRWALAAAARARARSQAVVQAGDQTRFLPTISAVGAALAASGGRLVFGHIHHFAHGEMAGRHYWVLPAFDADPIGLWASDGRLEPVRFEPSGHWARVPTPRPCPLAAS